MTWECLFPDGPATADVKIKVADSDGASDSASESVQVVGVANVAPSVTAAGDQVADEGTPVNVSLGSFTDPGSDTWSVDVNWGDGTAHSTFAASTGTLPAKAHTYDDNGTYMVTVTVTDKDGASDAKTFQVTVANLAPSATRGNDGPIVEGSAATVSFADQADASGADTAAGLRYAFRCDGSEFATAPAYADADAASSDSKVCAFADDGSHTVRARIIDKDGGFREYTTAVSVTNAAPVLSASAGQGSDEGQAKSFALGSFSDAGAEDSPWAVDVDWGDNSAHSTFAAATRGALDAKSHVYGDDGSYTVTVEVSDKDGATGTESFTVTVANVAPTVTLDAGNSLAADEGQTKTYSYTISDPGADTVSSVQTSCGTGGTKVAGSDTNTNSAGSFECRFPDGPADPVVSASATDSDGAVSNEATQSVHVANVAPTVRVSGPASVDEGSTETYSFTVGDPGADSFAEVDGFPDCDSAGADGSLVAGSYSADAAGGSFECSFPDGPATANVKIRVADSDGASGSASESVTVTTVANVAPSVTAPADQAADEGTPANVNLGSFSDPGSDTWSVDVDWGDGSDHGTFAAGTGTLPAKAHTYDDNGTYAVSVKVTDKDGASDAKTFQVTVANLAPTVTAPSDHTADEGATKDFGLGSFSDPGADRPWTVDVDWGDGSPSLHYTVDSAGSLGLASHAYADNGTYTVTLTVTDKDGASDTKTYKVTAANVVPTAKFTNNGPIAEGGSATIAFSEPADASTVDTAAGFRYAIRCDGSTPSAAEAAADNTKTCSFADNGTKTVKGIVVDKDGGSREYSTVVTVTNVAPVVTPPVDQTGSEGTGKAFDLGSFADAGAADGPWKVQVNWGDPATAPAQTLADRAATGPLGTASHTYVDNGVYTVGVTVTDKDGGKDTKTFKVTVTNVAPTITRFTGTDYIVGPNAFLDGSNATKSTFTTDFTDPGSDTWTGLFTYSDGSPLTETISPFQSGYTRSHTFASPGCKTASVKVTDDDGGSDTRSTGVKVSSGSFQPPMTNQPATDKLRNGQVLPVKVQLTDCAGAGLTALTPAIRLVRGDLTPQNDDATVAITPTSVSGADTTGVMRSQGGGGYMYNMQVNLPMLNTDYTVVIYPYGTSSPMELGHVIQATK